MTDDGPGRHCAMVCGKGYCVVDSGKCVHSKCVCSDGYRGPYCDQRGASLLPGGLLTSQDKVVLLLLVAFGE